MDINAFQRWISRKLFAFVGADRGNVALIFGIAVIPIVGVVGAAIDYSRASSARTAMQAALDATALALSKEAQQLTLAQLKAKAPEVFAANFHIKDAKIADVVPTFTSSDGSSFTLKMTATGSVGTTVAGIWTPSIAIGANSEVVWGMKRLELALALDNTGSMASAGKMTQLKIAAKDLLKTLQNAAKKPDDVKVSIIPFATDVNVGPGNANASWISWDDWDKDPLNSTCMKNNKEVKDSRGRRITDEDDCKDRDKNATWQQNAKSTWNGCVWDRDQPYDTNNTGTSGGIKATLYAAHQAANCPVPMMTLTSDWSALNAKIDQMQPVGNTNVTIGLQMAFQMLSPVAPFNASAPKADLDKVIILLTDGDNTQNRWYANNNNGRIDKRTELACKNAKDANIKLYTIRVIDGNATLLRGCATKTDMYFDVENAGELTTVFANIAQNLANLRLAH